jgi:hypothetical protein
MTAPSPGLPTHDADRAHALASAAGAAAHGAQAERAAQAEPGTRGPALGRRNPLFDPAPEHVRDTWAHLAATPSPAARVVVVVCGWRAPLASIKLLRRNLRTLMPGARVVPVGFPRASSVEQAGQEAMAALERAGVAGEPVDVVAVSMGGLVARALAAGVIDGVAPLRVERLLTLATPHRGAVLARFVRPDAAAAAMRPGSAFLSRLDEHLGRAAYELTPYALLRDWWVGSANTAPPGRTPIWIDGASRGARMFAHFMVSNDERIVLDCALRLRGMTPMSREGTPLPGSR